MRDNHNMCVGRRDSETATERGEKTYQYGAGQVKSTAILIASNFDVRELMACLKWPL